MKMLELVVQVHATADTQYCMFLILGVISTSCQNGDVKLWRAYGVGPAHDGLALYCKNSKWTPVCDDSWKCDNARLFCKKLGYAGVLSMSILSYYRYLINCYRYSWRVPLWILRRNS